MSRAGDITLMLILLQASIGFVNTLHVFDDDYIATPSNSPMNYRIVNLTDYQASVDSDEPSPTAVLSLGLSWLWEGFVIGVKILLTVVVVFPTLVADPPRGFGIPDALAVFLQIGIYFCYVIWYVQYKSGKAFKFYE